MKINIICKLLLNIFLILKLKLN